MKIYKSIVSVVVILAVLTLSISFLFMKDIDFSENENRYLQNLPEFSGDSLIEGSYIEELTSYMTDQFPARDEFISLRSASMRLIGFSDMNSVYFGRDGALMEKYTPVADFSETASRLNAFISNISAKVSVMLVPNPVGVYPENLPPYAQVESQADDVEKIYSLLDNCDKIDVYSQLVENKNERKLYYDYDPHWTSAGAYIAYSAFCENRGIDAVPEDEFEIKTVSDKFRGTLYSKVVLDSLGYDSVQVYYPRRIEYAVEYPQKGELSNSFEVSEYIDKKDKYSLFFGGNQPLIKITNKNIENTKSIAVIKDSYANCFVPFLISHYKHVYVIDTRYYKKNASEYINENAIEEVLLLYNMNSLSSNLGINALR